MPDDIAAQAIVSVIGGERKWEPERGPLLPFLKRVVDSLLNHLALSADNRRIERLSQNDRSLYEPSGSPFSMRAKVRGHGVQQNSMSPTLPTPNLTLMSGLNGW